MPLFFFISGYLFNDHGIDELPKFVVRKIKRLYLPFVICNIIALPFHNWLCEIGVYSIDGLFTNVKDTLKYIFKIFLCIKMEDIVAPLWFLPILMTVTIIYYLIRLFVRRFKKTELMTLMILLLGYIASFILIYIGRTSGLWRAMILVGTGAWIFGLGHAYKEYEEKISVYCHNYPTVIACFIAELVLSGFIDINMIQMRFSNPVIFTVCALFGINVIIFTSKKLWNRRTRLSGALKHLGNNSLVILEWHYWGALITTIIQHNIYKASIKGIVYYNGSAKIAWFSLYVLTGFGLPLIISGLKQKKRAE